MRFPWSNDTKGDPSALKNFESDGALVGTPRILSSPYVRTGMLWRWGSDYKDFGGQVHLVQLAITGSCLHTLESKDGRSRLHDLKMTTRRNSVIHGQLRVWSLDWHGRMVSKDYGLNSYAETAPFRPCIYELSKGSVVAHWRDSAEAEQLSFGLRYASRFKPYEKVVLDSNEERNEPTFIQYSADTRSEMMRCVGIGLGLDYMMGSKK